MPDANRIPEEVASKQAGVIMALQDTVLTAVEERATGEELANCAEAITVAITGLTCLQDEAAYRAEVKRSLHRERA